MVEPLSHNERAKQCWLCKRPHDSVQQVLQSQHVNVSWSWAAWQNVS